MPDLRWERRLLRQGYRRVAGVDEAGRGAWAGPVVAAAVVLPLDRPGLARRLRGVNDSKQLSPHQRERLFEVIHRVAVAVGVGSAGPAEIDRDGILAATRAAMQRAVAMLPVPPQALLVDAVDLGREVPLPQRGLIHGDALVLSIAAASIVAKVSRDRTLQDLDARYPGYGLGRHKGYGTHAHQQALQELGVADIHRRTFAPIRALLSLPPASP